MKRWVIAVLVLLAGAFLLARSFRGGGDGEVRLTGVVSANEAVVASELSGRLRELRVGEGDWVEKGQVVAVLATDELDAQRESKLATIDQLSTQVEQDREKVRLERARVTSQIEGATARLRAAESQRGEFLAQLDQAKKELAQTQELIDQGLAAARRLDRNEAMVSVVESRLQTAEDGIAAARAELELHRASERQVRVMEQQVEQTEARIAQARAELDQIAVRLGYTELRSPLSGMVSVRVAREGEFVAAGAPIVTIMDLSDVWVRAQVEETLVTQLVVGQPLPVRLASDEELTGRVTFISPEAEFATQRDVDRVKRDIRTFGIKVAVPNPDRRIHPGMTAYVILPANGELEALPPTPPPATLPPPVTTDARPTSSAPPEAMEEPAPEQRTRIEAPMETAETTPREASAAAPPPAASAAVSAAPRNGEPAGSAPQPYASSELPSLSAELPSDEEIEELLAGLDLETASEEDIDRIEAALLGETPSPPPAPLEEAPERTEPPGDIDRIEAALSGETPSSLPAPSGEAPERTERPEDLDRIEAALSGEAPSPPPAPSAEAPERTERPEAAGPENEGPSSASSLPPWAQPRPSSSPATHAPSLRLEGISRIAGKPVAIINGQRVHEGEVVGGARVVSIGDASVVVDRGGAKLTLTF